MDLNKELEHFINQTDCLIEANAALSPNLTGYSELTSIIGPLITTNISSLESVTLLVKNGYHREVLILSRPFIEGVVNIGYLCAEKQIAVHQAKQHALQRGYRDLFTGIEINSFSIKSKLEPYKSVLDGATPDNIKEAISKYTNKKGREITTWVDKTTKEKIATIGKKYGLKCNTLLSFAFFYTYKDVSEIIHNTYYGIKIFTGMQRKDISEFKTLEDAASFFGEHQKQLVVLTLQQISISIVALIDILTQEFKLDSLSNIFEKSNSILNAFAEKNVTNLTNGRDDTFQRDAGLHQITINNINSRIE